jgi:hypothetical protein
MDNEYGDDRPQRRDLTGALTGAVLGVILGLTLFLLLDMNASGLGLLLVSCVGGAGIGWILADRVSLDEWDPSLLSTRRPYVGAHAPDIGQKK